ncbi:NADP-dependent oxidoreductase [Bdellovibrio sp. HCB209]|uniref:NADP-dependent oxidoreductase n=1 Tax=Bdellovibrio sp. HCB209 TaxID=3394354 RepID=UPI0039B4E42C
MKAFVIDRYGKTTTFQERDLSVPKLKDNEVLVQVHAASINQLDAKIKSGAFKAMFHYDFPLVLGHDVAGVVTQVGGLVSRFKIGDEVYGRVSTPGSFAEYIAVPENDLGIKPKKLSMVDAASLPLVALTSWQAFVEKAHLGKEQKVFIQAGSGGVGTIAIQLGKYLGAQVATTTSKANEAMVRSLGADVIVDYRNEDFEDKLKEYDVVLHSLDSQTLDKSFRILKSGGKIVSISGPPDVKFAEDVGLSWLMKKIIYLISRKVRKSAKMRSVDYSFLFMKANGFQIDEISKLIESGALVPVVDRAYWISDINKAFEYIESGRAKGKVVLQVV